jgi:hypothetical protein
VIESTRSFVRFYCKVTVCRRRSRRANKYFRTFVLSYFRKYLRNNNLRYSFNQISLPPTVSPVQLAILALTYRSVSPPPPPKSSTTMATPTICESAWFAVRHTTLKTPAAFACEATHVGVGGGS